ncbi:TonB-dependent receptor [soil metagenome]
MITISMRRTLLASTIIAGTLLSAPAYAQVATPAEAPAADAGDTIIVTGSLLKNPNLVSSAPVLVVGRDEISLRQSNVAEEILRDLPGVVPDVGSAVNNGNGGASFVNLRGLGSNRNLVLLDGQRLVPANLNGSVDLNNIPLALIERVDSLTGGASTTYGADALAGVVNFITRKDFAGFEASVSEQINEQGDGNTLRADITTGANFDDGRGNVVLSMGYQKADQVLQGDRDFSSTAYDAFSGKAAGSGTSVPSRFTRPGFASQQLDPTTGTLVPTYALYNFNPVNIFQTPFTRYNIYAEGHYDISDKVTVYSRGMFSKNKVTQILAPGGAFGENVTINYNNPFLPAGARSQFCDANGLDTATCSAAAAATGPDDPNYKTFDTVVSRRTVELGGRRTTFTTQFFDYKAGFKYNISNSLSLDVGGSYGESENTAATVGNLRVSRLQEAALASSATSCDSGNADCVPINLFGPAGSITTAAGAFINGTTSVVQRASLAQAHALLSGDVGISTPFSDTPISFALGGEYRQYTASQESDVLSQTPGEISGSGGAAPNISGSYKVSEIYGELNVPLVSDKPFFKNLSVEAGLRYSHYEIDTAGSPKFNTTTYKAGGNWEPVDGLKLRGNYQHAVRAPNIGELFSPTQVTLTNLATDPCASLDSTGARQFAAPTGALQAVCLAQGATASNVSLIQNDVAGQPNATTGGNPALKPEKSNSYTFGVVIQPSNYIPGLSFTVDYYHIKVTGAITTATPSDAIAACFGGATASNGGAGLAAGAATSAACTAITRDPNTGGLYGNPGVVGGVPLPLSNLGVLLTDGIDISANYRRDLGFAKMNLSFTGNWTSRSKFQATPTSTNRECVGFYSTSCASIQPEFQWNTRATFSFGKIDASVLWRHIGAEKYEPQAVIESGTPAFAAFDHIKAYNYIDLALRLEVSDNFELTMTANNIFDKKPPVVGYNIGSTAYNSGNTYPSTYDALGRRYAVSARVKF